MIDSILLFYPAKAERNFSQRQRKTLSQRKESSCFSCVFIDLSCKKGMDKQED